MTAAAPEVLAIGEVMGLLDPDGTGPLEDVPSFRLRTAGAEANVLIGLSRLGHTTALITAVGQDPLGRLVQRVLAGEGVDTSLVRVDDTAPTGVFFKERFPDGERRVYYYRRGSAAARLRPDEVGIGTLPTSQVLVVSGLTLGIGGPDGLAGVAQQAIRELSGRGTTIVFDPNLRPAVWHGAQAGADFAAIRPYIDVLLTGRDELAALVPESTPEQAAADLCRAGIGTVVVKDGAAGALLFTGDGMVVIDPVPVDEVVDTVGAGDAFTAGFVSGLLRGWPAVNGARLGAALGAAAVTHTGDWEALPAGEWARTLVKASAPDTA